MEGFSALLALCARNSSVTDEFPSQRASNADFDVGLHKLLNKRPNDRWFETLWRSCDVIVMRPSCSRAVMVLTLSTVAPDVVITTAYGVIRDEKVGIMTTLGFQCQCRFFFLQYFPIQTLEPNIINFASLYMYSPGRNELITLWGCLYLFLSTSLCLFLIHQCLEQSSCDLWLTDRPIVSLARWLTVNHFNKSTCPR